MIAVTKRELFILKTFKTWDIEPPGIILTDDDIRGQYDSPIVKPSVELYNLFYRKWLEQNLRVKNPIIKYMGDDPVKDGELAKNAGISFGWFNPEGQICAGLQGFSFTNWMEIIQHIKQWGGV